MLDLTSIPVSSDISTTSIIAAAISCFSCTVSLSHCFKGPSKGFVSIALRLRHIPFENSLSEEQIEVFHKILDCVSETAGAEMRAAYTVGLKDGGALMSEV